MQEEAAEAMDRARLLLEQAAKRRKRKKKRKKRVPRTSSHSSCGRARCRQRQWHARNAGFCDDPPRAVFPSSVGLPELPAILVGVFQKDSGVLFVDSGSGMSQAGFADISARAVFLGWQAHDVQHHGRYVPKDSCDMVPMFRLQKTAESPQLQSVQVVDIFFVLRRLIPMVSRLFSRPQRFPSCCSTSGG